MLHAAYGPSLWPLLYQADVRCRQELIEAIFHELLAKHNAALEIHEKSSFNVEKPWDQVWEAATNHTVWWTDHFERPAGLIGNHIRALSSALDGDVLTASSSALSGGAQPNQPQKGRGKQRQRGGVKHPAAKNNQSPKGGKGGKNKNCNICQSATCPGASNMRECPRFDPNYKNKKGKGRGKDTGKGVGW